MSFGKISAFLFASIFFMGVPAHGQTGPDSTKPSDLPCKTETDEFTQRKIIRCETVNIQVESQPRRDLFYHRAGIREVDEQPLILFVTGSDSWNFLSVDRAYAIIDGKNYDFELMNVSSETTDTGSVSEQNAILLTTDHLQRISDAKKFRVKIGHAIFRIPLKSIKKQAKYVINN